jgi:hypothetical protein
MCEQRDTPSLHFKVSMFEGLSRDKDGAGFTCLLCVCAVRCLPVGPDGRVVSGRPTSQTGSVMTGPGGSANAVNGLTPQQVNDSAASAYGQQYYGSSTAAATSPWWAVDLGVALPLTAVQITAVTADGAGSAATGTALRGYELRMSNTSASRGVEGVVVVSAGTAHGTWRPACGVRRIGSPLLERGKGGRIRYVTAKQRGYRNTIDYYPGWTATDSDCALDASTVDAISCPEGTECGKRDRFTFSSPIGRTHRLKTTQPRHYCFAPTPTRRASTATAASQTLRPTCRTAAPCSYSCRTARPWGDS